MSPKRISGDKRPGEARFFLGGGAVAVLGQHEFHAAPCRGGPPEWISLRVPPLLFLELPMMPKKRLS
jgi:hypothetical protein